MARRQGTVGECLSREVELGVPLVLSSSKPHLQRVSSCFRVCPTTPRCIWFVCSEYHRFECCDYLCKSLASPAINRSQLFASLLLPACHLARSSLYAPPASTSPLHPEERAAAAAKLGDAISVRLHTCTSRRARVKQSSNASNRVSVNSSHMRLLLMTEVASKSHRPQE